ncbi:glycoside hydrolase family 3 protein [Schaalia sp. 19OD2882]|uniref:glycoside hydrolase family 3 protein n=1 Tax=Schaalia sp. 19OD2882 TaxID=2794089 RepID=UPI001C1F0D2E|nr:glycoside hydrolase family 3 protein [Schaalia sp. 19OD2882]QWW20408.1 glycoside hydrolase family 3 protein [Schaalia sp. 19OD2882]
MADTKARTPMSNTKFLGIWGSVLAVLLVLVIIVNVAIGIFDRWIGSQLGAGTYEVINSEAAQSWDTTYYTADYADLDSHMSAASALIEQIEAEGVVLAKNEGAALPLSSGAKVTMFGRAAADPVYGGAGSGSVDVTKAVNARTGLENAGFVVNDTVYQSIATWAEGNARGDIVMDKPEESSYTIGELPVAQYEANKATFADYGDAALVFIGRPGGEGGDLARDMKGWDDNYTEGQHQLELNKDEKDLIELAKANFDKVVILVNASTTMELGTVQADTGVDSILLIGSPGLSGFNGVGQVLSGKANPSGRTTDIWAADFTKDPTFVNFGSFVYDDLKVSYPSTALANVASNQELSDQATFVNYQEGVYLGYRYYETAAAEGFIDYDQAVVYPFGHGLSYTTFEWSAATPVVGDAKGTVTVEVTVKNTGTAPGKDVVEVYYSAPYTKGGIEKPSVVLGGFAKTPVIAPGASEKVTVEFPVQDMASYDYKGEGAYVLEKGAYGISVRKDSHTVAPGTTPYVHNIAETVVFNDSNPRQGDDTAAVNRFDAVSAAFTDDPADKGSKILNMSRADFKGTFPTAPAGDLMHASDVAQSAFAVHDHQGAAAAAKVEMPKTGVDSDLTLIDLRGLPYDDPKWDELLDSISVDDMTDMLLNGAYNSAAIPSVGKPAVTDLDGPAGFSSFINASVNGPAFTSEFLLAQTWNVDLAEQMGEMVGNESLLKQVSGWYAPAMNLHRSPFAGRNFEYYSEDPLLSGKMAAAVSRGAGSKGLYTTLKHFALNDQETNRVNNGVSTWANEQTIREIYLRPFEIAVKEVTLPVTYISDDQGTLAETEIGAAAVMSSFNRIGGVWAGGDRRLMHDVLRGEWGFTGFAITDFNLYNYMSPDQAIAAGTDLTLSFAPSKAYADTSSAYAVANLRQATKNVLYTVANSNAMVGLAPGATVTYTPPTWKYVQWGVSALLVLLIAGGGVLVARRVRAQAPTRDK